MLHPQVYGPAAEGLVFSAACATGHSLVEGRSIGLPTSIHVLHTHGLQLSNLYHWQRVLWVSPSQKLCPAAPVHHQRAQLDMSHAQSYRAAAGAEGLVLPATGHSLTQGNSL